MAYMFGRHLESTVDSRWHKCTFLKKKNSKPAYGLTLLLATQFHVRVVTSRKHSWS